MSSHQEEEQAGPSGLTTEEILTLLHTSDSEKQAHPLNALKKSWETVTRMKSVKRRWIASNANVPFKPTSFNKVEQEVWMLVQRAPSNLS